VGRKILHLDAFSGAAGNMFMGALLDLGLKRKTLLEGLEPLGLEFKLVVKKVDRSGFAARYVDVRVPGAAKKKKEKRARSHDHEHGHSHSHDHDHRDGSETHSHSHSHAHSHGQAGDHGTGRRYAEIRQLLERARLAPAVKPRALAIFEILAHAEAKVHGTSIDDVHFHEVGAIDAIVDITAAAIGLDALAIDHVSCSPVAIGHGTIDSDHGLLPLPAPATLELIVGMPTVPAGVAWETLTPTGAAILRTIVDEYCAFPAMTIERVGYGAGNDRRGALPNVLRAVLGHREPFMTDRIVCLETNLDDLVPEHFDHLMERLFDEGALDVSLQHLQMKKNRPGFLVRVLARPLERDTLARILFAESTTIGVRMAEWDRLLLERKRIRVATDLGPVHVKVIRGLEGQVEFSPEYDDCKRVARKHSVALREVVRKVADQARQEWKE
jgi:hypothetical protein